MEMSLKSTASSASLLPGDRAPDFTLNSVLDNKEEQVKPFLLFAISEALDQVSLSSLRGQHTIWICLQIIIWASKRPPKGPPMKSLE